MNQKTFCRIMGLIFLFMALLHSGMFILGESVIVFGRPTPVWSNLIIALFSAYFAYQGLKLSRKP